ncbi:hypothetical protein [Phenylobacterium sp.]|uniref:hypothetical protein n=1 Tax=Phenylobacterium sp. TaxID=1871053 RepID=UPI0025D2BDFA|nr:hypothetical protein [Phenylobacterium sp.]
MHRRLVVDSNMLQSASLRGFLASPTNVAVLPDFVWFEMYKQRSLSGVQAAFSVISDSPSNVAVLKSGHEVAALDPRLTSALAPTRSSLRMRASFSAYSNRENLKKKSKARFRSCSGISSWRIVVWSPSTSLAANWKGFPPLFR